MNLTKTKNVLRTNICCYSYIWLNGFTVRAVASYTEGSGVELQFSEKKCLTLSLD